MKQKFNVFERDTPRTNGVSVSTSRMDDFDYNISAYYLKEIEIDSKQPFDILYKSAIMTRSVEQFY
jgi:hypothetical protein